MTEDGVVRFATSTSAAATLTYANRATYSALGTVVWTGLLTGAGYGLGENYRLVGRFVEPIGNGVLILAMLLYLYRVATFERGSDARG